MAVTVIYFMVGISNGYVDITVSESQEVNRTKRGIKEVIVENNDWNTIFNNLEGIIILILGSVKDAF